MNLEALLKKAMELEKAQAMVYKGLEKKFSFSDEISKFWSSMAEDEKGHHKLILIVEMYNKISPEKLSAEVSDELYNRVCKGLNGLKLSRLEGILDLDNACKLASEIEDYEMEAVFEFVRTEFMCDSRLEVSNLLLAHLDKLSGFLERFSSIDERRRIKAL